MLIPEIQPDEFGYGYFIRLGLLNGLPRKYQAERFVTNGAGITHIAKRIADICGKRLEEYCRHHTLLPIHRAFSSLDDECNHGSEDNPYAIKRYGYMSLLDELHLCKTCISEDLDYLGYSYYRRSHQIPGVCVCSKHKSEADEGQLFRVPIETFRNPDTIDSKYLIPTTLYKNPIIDRYHEIQDSLCEFKKSIAVGRIIDDLQTNARKKGLRWSIYGRNALFSDYLVESVPCEWLAEMVPAMLNKTRGKKMATLDGILSPQGRSFASKLYVLAFAALYEDADEALFVIQQSSNKNARPIVTAKSSRSNFWSKHPPTGHSSGKTLQNSIR